MINVIEKNSVNKKPKLGLEYIAEILNVPVSSIHKKLKNNNITNDKFGSKAYITHSTARKIFNIKFDRRKVAFQIVKGGTGKTTSIFNISCAASLYGAKILCIDMDPQGNLTNAFGIDADKLPVLIDVIKENVPIRECVKNVEEGIDLISSRIENIVLDTSLAVDKFPLHNLLNRLLKPIEQNYDFIFIDCPPSIGHSVTAVSLYVDIVLMPLNPDKFSASGLNILREEINNINQLYEKNIQYKVFLNKHNSKTKLSDKFIRTTMTEEAELGNALDSAVCQAQEIPNSLDLGYNVFSKLSNSSARIDFDNLTRELLNINLNELTEKFSER